MSYLPSKAAKVALTKVSLHQDLGEELWLVDLEGFSVGKPADDVLVTFLSGIVQDCSKLQRKASTWALRFLFDHSMLVWVEAHGKRLWLAQDHLDGCFEERERVCSLSFV